MNNLANIRQPAVAGLFYPDNKVELDREIARYLESAPELDITGKIYGLVAPHAGYMYSGGVAARAYRQVLDYEVDTVVVVSPSHREYFTEVSVFNGGAYMTPLGPIPVAKDLAEELASCDPSIILSEKGHRFEEHALEVQLPFLQKVLDDFHLLPVVMGEHSKANIEILSSALVEVFEHKKVLFVASSDLSHFYDAAKAEKMDKIVTDNVTAFDAPALFDNLQNGKCEMCGGGPVVAVMRTCQRLGASQARVLMYRHSGEITNDKSEVVGYLSALFLE
jgi:AmmeMemoRadiSam system protein B